MKLRLHQHRTIYLALAHSESSNLYLIHLNLLLIISYSRCTRFYLFVNECLRVLYLWRIFFNWICSLTGGIVHINTREVFPLLEPDIVNGLTLNRRGFDKILKFDTVVKFGYYWRSLLEWPLGSSFTIKAMVKKPYRKISGLQSNLSKYVQSFKILSVSWWAIEGKCWIQLGCRSRMSESLRVSWYWLLLDFVELTTKIVL